MSIEDSKITAEVGSTRELNHYLQAGWTLILSYVKHSSDTQQPRFVVAWQTDDEPNFPELLDEWERREMRQNMKKR